MGNNPYTKENKTIIDYTKGGNYMKQLMITGCILLAIGIIIFVLAFAASGWDITKMSTVRAYTMQTYVSQNPITSIVVDDDNMTVEVKKSKDDRVHVNYFTNDNDYYEITENGVLSIDRVTNYKWYHYIFQIDFHKKELTIYLPEQYDGDLDIKTSNAKIEVEDISARRIDLKTSNSSIDMEDSSFTEVAKMKSSNGRIEATNVTSAGDMTAKTSNSKIDITNVSVRNMDSETSNGSINLERVTAVDTIRSSTSNSHIAVERVDCGNIIDLKTSNGSITGDLKGTMSEYIISAKTSNGNNNLPENKTDGTKKLLAKTSNSKIEIEFMP